MPLKYHWAWDYYTKGCANHWMPNEVAMQGDIELWKSNRLTAEERQVILRNLGFFSTAESLVGNNIVDVYKRQRNIYDGVRIDEIEKAMVFAAKSRIELEPAYGYITARLLLDVIYRETLPGYQHYHDLAVAHATRFKSYLEEGVAADRISPKLLEFDLEKIASALKPERDLQFNYMGLQTIYDRYLIHIDVYKRQLSGRGPCGDLRGK